jgi:hypothetical protein
MQHAEFFASRAFELAVADLATSFGLGVFSAAACKLSRPRMTDHDERIRVPSFLEQTAWRLRLK